jgi:hypothetical protein
MKWELTEGVDSLLQQREHQQLDDSRVADVCVLAAEVQRVKPAAVTRSIHLACIFSDVIVDHRPCQKSLVSHRPQLTSGASVGPGSGPQHDDSSQVISIAGCHEKSRDQSWLHQMPVTHQLPHR